MYRASLILQRAAGSDVATIETRLENARDELERQKRVAKYAPWVGAAVGTALGLALLFLDAVSRAPIMQRWFLALPMLAFAASMCGAAGAVYVYFAGVMRESYLLKASPNSTERGGSSTSTDSSFGHVYTDGGKSSQSTSKPKIRRKVENKPPWAKSRSGTPPAV